MMDLHTHSICSDGACTPMELLKMAEARNLRYFAITDHDNMDAYLQIEGQTIYHGKLICGVEMTFSYQGMTMDMLGYGVDRLRMEASGQLYHLNGEHIRIREQKRLEQLFKAGKKLGLKINPDLCIRASHERANDVLCDHILMNPENTRILEAMHISNRTTFYRNHYLNPNSPFYMETKPSAPTMKTIADAIHDSGGLTFLAHPFVYDVTDTWKLLDNLVHEQLLDGIECLHRRHSRAISEQLLAYCDRLHLYKSGGSDLHQVKHRMGYGDNGTLVLSENIASDWLKKLYKKRYDS